MSKGEKSVIIGFRIDRELKEIFGEMAEERNQTLTDFILDLIEAGFERVCKGEGDKGDV